MLETSFKPGLVCRGAELAVLISRLGGTLAGKGCAVLVAGEAGVGKSRLCEEFLSYAEGAGASVARGWCVEGTLEPLHPVREALVSLGIGHVLDDTPPPELLCLYMLDAGGVLVASASKSGDGIDADIFSGMLQAISNFAKDSLSPLGAGHAQLGSIAYGDFRITARTGGSLTLASITRGRENEPLLVEMDALLSEHAPALANWTGDIAEAATVKAALEALVGSGRYRGRHLVDDPGLRKGGLMSSILGGLSRAAAQKPIVLYLDDLQWADPTTVSLVHYLARNASSAKLMVLGTYRPEDVAPVEGRPHHLASAIKTMSREGVVSTVELGRFGAEGSRELVESALGGSTLEEAFYSRLQREGGGNPFYTLELLKLTTESGGLAIDAKNKWRLAKAVDELEMPERVADIVGRRLDRMAPDDARLLSAAAVLGEEFTLEPLTALAGGSRFDMAGRLDAIESGTGLVRSAASGYRFDHAKVREAAYQRLGVGMRRELHRMAAEALVKGGLDGRLSEIALHLHSAGDPRAQERLAAAAHDAMVRFAMEEAARLYRLAAGYGPLGREAAMEMADCERNAGQYDDAFAIYKGIQEGSEGIERGVLLTQMADVRNMQSKWPEGCALGNEAFSLLEPLGPSPALTKACHVMYHVNMKRGTMKDAESWALRQMDIASGSGDAASLASAHHDLGTLYLQTRRFDEALPHLEAAASGRRALGDLVGLASSLNNVGAVHHNRGVWEKAVEHYREALAIKRAIGDARGIAITATNLGIVSKSRGDPRGAVRFFEESLGIRKRIGDQTGQITSLNGIGLMWLQMLESEKAASCLSEGLVLAERIGDFPGLGTTCANLGDLCIQTGSISEARKYLERGIEIGKRIGDGLMQSLCGASLAEVCVIEGRLDEAHDLLTSVKASAEEMKAESLMADYYRATGLLRAAMGDATPARASFLDAIEIHGRIKDGSPMAKAKRTYAQFCRSVGDSATADRLAREILEFAKTMGAEKLAEVAKAENPGIA